MLNVQSEKGIVDIFEMNGTINELICDIGAICHKAMLLIANDGAKSKEDVFLRYGTNVKQLVRYIEMTAKSINEIESIN